MHSTSKVSAIFKGIQFDEVATCIKYLNNSVTEDVSPAGVTTLTSTQFLRKLEHRHPRVSPDRPGTKIFQGL